MAAAKIARIEAAPADAAPAGVISFERTEDVELIRSIVTHPKVYGFMHDDDAPAREDWMPGFGPRLSWMLARYDGEPVGLIIVREHSNYLWELHLAFLPWSWGGLALECFRQFIQGTWRYSKCQRLFGQIAASNRRAIKFVNGANVWEFAVHPRSLMKDCRMQDQILVAIDRPVEQE